MSHAAPYGVPCPPGFSQLSTSGAAYSGEPATPRIASAPDAFTAYPKSISTTLALSFECSPCTIRFSGFTSRCTSPSELCSTSSAESSCAISSRTSPIGIAPCLSTSSNSSAPGTSPITMYSESPRTFTISCSRTTFRCSSARAETRRRAATSASSTSSVSSSSSSASSSTPFSATGSPSDSRVPPFTCANRPSPTSPLMSNASDSASSVRSIPTLRSMMRSSTSQCPSGLPGSIRRAGRRREWRGGVVAAR
mmetsp:Transcript_66775/g.118229  ORF Transcript_66775/g.118229 Transcript_66775/m.118229 type:complete len:252 (+) Transcript_66775:215-970(+)